MGLLKPMTSSASFLKAGFLGFQGSGKTRTAVELAIGVREHFGLKEPIAFFDTESGSDYVRDLIEKRTGVPLLGVKSHSFDDLMQVAEESIGSVSVLLADSMTHVWREVCASYLAEVNERLRRYAEKQGRPFYPRRKLEFQDWADIKSKWFRWTNFYLNSPLHIIVCGRAGFEYDMQEDDEGKKKELVKTGIKMRAEGEFGYEPNLLVEMERVQRFDGDHTFRHLATVVKDRSDRLNGKRAEDPGFEFFRPHIEFLNPAAHAPIDTSLKTQHGVGEDGDGDWHREKRSRVIAAEEIQGELVRAHPGQTAAEKEAKMALLERVFGTRSWTKISESTPSDRMRRGLDELRGILRPAPSVTSSTDPQDQLPDFADSSGDAAPPTDAAPPAQGPAADAPPPPAQTAAAPEGETKPKRARRTSKAPAPAAAPPAPPPPPEPEQTSLPVDPPAQRAAPEMDVADIHEIEQTIARLADDPSWADGVAERIRAIPDGMLKARLWGLLQDAKRDLLYAQAKAEAAARAEGAQ